jgi:hypothetical protein
MPCDELDWACYRMHREVISKKTRFQLMRDTVCMYNVKSDIRTQNGARRHVDKAARYKKRN